MMRWGYLLLAITGCFAGSISLYLHRKTNRLKYLGLLTASFFFVLVETAQVLSTVFTGNIGSFIIEQSIEWGQIFCLACLLSTLLLFVRESKPEFSRFPVFYVVFPVIIIISYLLVYNSIILKKWLLELYKGGAVSVAVLLYGIYYYRESIYWLAFVGALLFFITYGVYLVLPVSYRLVWQVLLMTSIYAQFGGYYIVEQRYKVELKNT